jgi:peroxin-3
VPSAEPSQSRFNHSARSLLTRIHSFSSSLLPSTPETLNHVLTRAGIRVTPPAHLNLPIMDISLLGAHDPPATSGSDCDHTFNNLLGETANIIASANFSRVLEVALDHVSEEILLSGILANVFGRVLSDHEEADRQAAEPKMRLAAMLPGLARWSRLALTGLPNELVDVSLSHVIIRLGSPNFFQRLGELREVKALSAIIFASFGM